MMKGNLQAQAAVLCDFSICFCETAIAPMGFMACSLRLDQTGMYLKNEYSVFKGHPDFRPYKVGLTRVLLFRVGPSGALWLSLWGATVRFDFFSVLCSLIGAKKHPVAFPFSVSAVSTALRCSFVFVSVRAIHHTLPQTAL